MSLLGSVEGGPISHLGWSYMLVPILDKKECLIWVFWESTRTNLIL